MIPHYPALAAARLPTIYSSVLIMHEFQIHMFDLGQVSGNTRVIVKEDQQSDVIFEIPSKI
jgi:hypothetical protein